MTEKVLFTAGKLAKEWNISPKVIKDAIKELVLKPDAKKGACNYYAKETVEKIKAHINK